MEKKQECKSWPRNSQILFRHHFNIFKSSPSVTTEVPAKQTAINYSRAVLLYFNNLFHK